MISGGGYRNRTGLLGFAIQSNTEQNQGRGVSKATPTNREPNGKVSSPEFKTTDPTNENPGALAGATGADSFQHFKSEEYRNRAKAATALCYAIADCDPEDACYVMESALVDLSFGSPLPVFLSPMEDALFWSSYATRNELKAYAVACLEAMNPNDQSAFLGYIHQNLSKLSLRLDLRKHLFVALFESFPDEEKVAFLRRVDPVGRFARAPRHG
jgi:hypothetical protein